MQNVITTEGMPGDTFTMTSTNASQALTAASIVGSSGNPCIGVFISCETNDIKFCLGGSTPVCAGLGHVLPDGGNIYLSSGNAAKTFRFVDSVDGSHGVIQVTPFFEFGRT